MNMDISILCFLVSFSCPKFWIVNYKHFFFWVVVVVVVLVAGHQGAARGDHSAAGSARSSTELEILAKSRFVQVIVLFNNNGLFVLHEKTILDKLHIGYEAYD